MQHNMSTFSDLLYISDTPVTSYKDRPVFSSFPVTIIIIIMVLVRQKSVRHYTHLFWAIFVRFNTLFCLITLKI